MRQLENMVNVAFVQANGGSAVYAPAPVALIDKLTDFAPEVFWHPVKPGILFSVQFKSNHAVPFLVLP